MKAVAHHPENLWLPPPLLFVLPLILGLLLDRLFAISFLPTSLSWIGVAALLIGGAFALSGAIALRRAGTTIIPNRPNQSFVTSGPYSVTRNPLYLGFTLMYCGAAILADTLWPILFLPLIIIVLHRTVIRHEEAYLERRFGSDYRSYRARVRSWI